jgi:two-component system invasion response regulator UvrY
LARKRIVLAEDHPDVAHRLVLLLGHDYDVQLVRDGAALIAAVDRCPPDVIVSDVVMPGTGGLDAARAILDAHPDARIIFVSVRDEPAMINMALKEGVRGYVVKADAGEELDRAVSVVLGGERFVSSSAKAALRRTDLSGGSLGRTKP